VFFVDFNFEIASTQIVSNCSKATLQGIIRGKVDPDAVINSGGWPGYDGLVELGFGHVRVNHSKDEFVRNGVHINGIEWFWGVAKVRLTKFKGIPAHTFHLHLKETEWRYNNRNANKEKILLQYLETKIHSPKHDPFSLYSASYARSLLVSFGGKSQRFCFGSEKKFYMEPF